METGVSMSYPVTPHLMVTCTDYVTDASRDCSKNVSKNRSDTLKPLRGLLQSPEKYFGGGGHEDGGYEGGSGGRYGGSNRNVGGTSGGDSGGSGGYRVANWQQGRSHQQLHHHHSHHNSHNHRHSDYSSNLSIHPFKHRHHSLGAVDANKRAMTSKVMPRNQVEVDFKKLPVGFGSVGKGEEDGGMGEDEEDLIMQQLLQPGIMDDEEAQVFFFIIILL